MKSYELFKSNKAGKKFCVFNGSRVIHFGATGYSDYTIHKDKDRMIRYSNRHKNKENWKNKDSAGFWAKWILWNKPSLKASITDIKKRFRIGIKSHLTNAKLRTLKERARVKN